MAPSGQNLGSLYPAIQWRQPLPVRCGDVQALGCRICIATKGLKGEDVEKLPKTMEEFEQHMRSEHPQ